MDTQMLIGSKFERGTEQEEPILNPKTGETVLGMPEASQGQIEDAVAAAEKAFSSWSRTTPAQSSSKMTLCTTPRPASPGVVRARPWAAMRRA